MTTTTALTAEPREETGKGPARRLRQKGRVPAIIYGGSDAPVQVSLEERELLIELKKPGFFTRLIDLKLGNGSLRTIVRDLQLHPVSDRPEHVDLLRVGKDTKVSVFVPVRFHGHTRSPGIKRGGVLNIVRHEVELICTPEAIPEHLDIDISSARIGDSFHVRHLTLPEGVTPAIADRDFTIATIAGRGGKDDADEADAGEGAADGDAKKAEVEKKDEKK